MFAGVGGFSLGLRQEGYEIVGSCECDPSARSVYLTHFGDLPHPDVKLLDIADMPDFDILTAGFPCQPFSIAGKCKGLKDCRSDIFFEIIRIATLKRPRFLLLENTAGLLNNANGAAFARVLQALWECGYDCQWEVIDSQHYLPQHRKRLFIVCTLRKEIPNPPTIFPLLHGKKKSQEPIKKRKKSRLQTGKGELFVNTTFMDSCKTNRIRERTATPTLTTTALDFGVIQKKEIRRLTPTEFERLQGFPDGWTAGLAVSRRYMLLGNAVSVPVVRVIGRSIMEAVAA